MRQSHKDMPSGSSWQFFVETTSAMASGDDYLCGKALQVQQVIRIKVDAISSISVESCEFAVNIE